MSDIETLKAEIKKLSAKATQAKMDLHDLSEELPLQWQDILTVAQRAHAVSRPKSRISRLASTL